MSDGAQASAARPALADERRWLLLVLAVAFMLRVGLAFGLQAWLDDSVGRRFLIAGDADGYWELGRRLASGDEYSLYNPPRHVLRMPGFPALLAVAIRLVPGRPELAARLLLALTGTVACGLVWLLARLLNVPRAGVPAAAFCAISPLLAGFSVVLLSETLFAACLLLSLCGVAWLALPRAGDSASAQNPAASQNPPEPTAPASRIPSVLRAMLAGLCTAAAVYARPAWLLAAPLLGVMLLVAAWRHRWSISPARMIGLVLVLHLTVAAALLPWALRNRQVTGHLVWTTLWMGPSLYDGLHPGATGLSDMTFFEADRAQLAGLSEYEINEVYRQRALEFLRNEPGRALILAGVKQLRYWSPWPNAAGFRHPLLRTAVALFSIPLLLLAGYGAWQFRRQWWLLALTLGPLLYFAALHTLFVGSLRYRLPAEYPLSILAAAGLLTLRNHIPGNTFRHKPIKNR
ncbi:MAG: hypothetical protein KDA79_06885 [Planctomycetaceae bacterium]|nr:hypothetical protein [Planctomycetaceae bacterium]